MRISDLAPEWCQEVKDQRASNAEANAKMLRKMHSATYSTPKGVVELMLISQRIACEEHCSQCSLGVCIWDK